MSWKQWLAKGDIKGHQTSKQELDNLRALIARDLADAAIVGLSADRRFPTGEPGCRPWQTHKITFEAAALALGPDSGRTRRTYEDAVHPTDLMSS